ncbi:MAG: hypothetical protein RL065_689 [Bacteroidota bacterium]
MKKIISISVLLVAFISCNNNSTSVSSSQDARFDIYKNRFVENLWKVYPSWASSQGYHKYDSVLIVPNEAEHQQEIAFAKAQLDSLKQFDLNTLSSNDKIDYYMIKNQMESTIWSINEMKSWEWNPSEYNVCGSFSELLAGNYAPLNQRMNDLYLKMKNITTYYEAAKANIKNPTIEHTQLAIDQNLGGVSVFENDFIDSLKKINVSDAQKQLMTDASKAAAITVKDYVEFLKKLDNKTPRSFRLGKDLYAKKFDFDIQSAYSADEIYQKAIEHKKELHGKMYELANQLWSKYMMNASKPKDSLQLIRQVIDKISLTHTQPDSFQTTIEHQLPELVKFISDKNLIYIDPKKPLVVRREPAYMAGVAGASISAPGPYDKNGNTYYNVGTLANYSKEKAESYLREYNKYILQILNIHEAIPGHYTQLVYSNQSPSIIKSLFGNNAMIEGWAVYGERMMLENGYGNNEPEMWLMYYKWNLRSTCNTILDNSVHSRYMSKEEAMHLLMEEAFQQKAEAEGKWRRVSVTQVQLCCYFTGFTEIYEFREAQKKKLGDKFDLKKFHEQFLSYGSAPVKYIKELMGN